jgi:FAD/FMN-containing dehydrogenase
VSFAFVFDIIMVMNVLFLDAEAETSKDKAKAAFKENYPRLQRVKKQYDPENIFNKWFAITPA